MRKLNIHLFGRFFAAIAMACTMAVSAQGGIFEVGASSYLPATKNQIYDDQDQAWTFNGNWSELLARRAYDGHLHLSNTIGGYATISITGSRFTLVFSKAESYGELDVYVDNIKIHTINQKKSRTSHQMQWTSPDMGWGLHVVKFVHVSGKTANIDAIKVQGTTPTPSSVPTSDSTTTTPASIPPVIPTLTVVTSPTNTIPAENPTLFPTPTSSPIPSLIPTFTVSPTQSPVPSPTMTFTATSSPTPTQSPTPILVPSATPTALGSGIVVSSGESIQTKCVNAASAGTTCQVNSGTYAERVTLSKSISLVCTGTCLVTGGFDITANNAVLRGFEVTVRGITAKGQYNVIENNYVHDLTSEVGILVYDGLNTNHITIKNNTITRANNACILIGGNSDLMEGNNCSNTKQPQTTSGDADCFRYFGGNHILRSNYCHDIWYGPAGYDPSVGDYVGDTAHIDCFQTYNAGDRGGAGHDTLFEKNFCDVPDAEGQVTAKAFQTTGLTASRTIDLTTDYPCRNLMFKNNVVHSNFLAIFNYCQNITLLNNTFVGDLDASALGLQLQNLRGTNTIQYNIFVDQDNQAFTLYSGDTSATVVGGYNVIYRSSGVPVGSPQPGDLWDVDPQFVNPAAKDYHLKPGSPACGMGAFPCQ